MADIDIGAVEGEVLIPERGEAAPEEGHEPVSEGSLELTIPLSNVLRAPLSLGVLMVAALGGERGLETEFDVRNRFPSSLSPADARVDLI